MSKITEGYKEKMKDKGILWDLFKDDIAPVLPINAFLDDEQTKESDEKDN